MPLSLNGQYVVVDFSPPLTQPDGSATVYAQIFVNGERVGGPEAVQLDADDVAAVYSAAPMGETITQAVGAAILQRLSDTNRTFGAHFAADYVPTVMPPTPAPSGEPQGSAEA